MRRVKSLKVTSLILVLAIICSMFGGTVFAKQQKDSTSATTQSINDCITSNDDQIKQIVESNSVFNENGMTIVNENEIVKEFGALDLAQLQKAAESKGAVFSEDLTEKSLLKIIEKGIKSFNDRIKNKELKVLKNGTVVDSSDDSFYIQGGVDREASYWWGIETWYCTNCAWEFQAQLYKAALAVGTSGGVAGIFSAGVGVIIGLAGAGYFTNLAVDIGYQNSITTRGLVVDLDWWLVYTINAQ